MVCTMLSRSRGSGGGLMLGPSIGESAGRRERRLPLDDLSSHHMRHQDPKDIAETQQLSRSDVGQVCTRISGPFFTH
jgi:hypothetical protein